MDNTVVSNIKQYKQLGVVLFANGTWDYHIDLIISKASRRLNILRNFKFKLNRTALQHIYFSFIRPVLEYADIIWYSQSIILKNRVESIQIEAALD